MAGNYVKLFGSILNSSVWCAPGDTRLVWITLLLLADSEGRVWGAVPGIARQAGVPLLACRGGSTYLEAPDPDSRTTANEGRRILPIDGGWQIVNAQKYREMQSDGQVKASIRAQAYRDRHRGRDASRESRIEEEEKEEEESKEESEKERTKARPRKPQRVVAVFDRPETRSLVDAYNELIPAKIGYSPGNLRAADRALAEGYTEEQSRTVFQAVHDGATETAAWCRDTNHEFEYLIRPTHRHHRTGEITQGTIDKILNELATGRKAG